MLADESQRQVELERSNLSESLDQAWTDIDALNKQREHDTADREMLSTQHATQLEQIMKMRDEMEQLRADNEAMAKLREENARLHALVAGNERSDLSTSAGMERYFEFAIDESDSPSQLAVLSGSGSVSTSHSNTAQSPTRATPTVVESSGGPDLLRVARVNSDLKASAPEWEPTRPLGQYHKA